jgi:hypothetical protein
LFYVLFSNYSFAGDETLLKVLCAPDLKRFEITATSVDFNYYGIPDKIDKYSYMKNKYSLYKLPSKDEVIKCSIGKNRYQLSFEENNINSGFVLIRNEKKLIDNFLIDNEVYGGGVVIYSISLGEVWDFGGFIKVYVFNKKAEISPKFIVFGGNSLRDEVKIETIQADSLIK